MSTIINEVNLLRYFTKVKKNQYFLQEILFTCNEVNILLNNYFFTSLLLFYRRSKKHIAQRGVADHSIHPLESGESVMLILHVHVIGNC